MSYDIQIRVSSLKRSGTHAIINWIASLYNPSRIMFVNDRMLGYNPLTKMRNKLIIGKSGYMTDPLPCLNNINNYNQDVLIFNREDEYLTDVRDSLSARQQHEWFGTYNKIYDVIILRDALNCFAGKWIFDKEKMPNYTPNIHSKTGRLKIVSIWKEYAKEIMGFSDILPFKKIPINYNLWCISTLYRTLVAGMFYDIDNEIGIINQVPGYGWGSSFDSNKSLRKDLKCGNIDKRVFMTRYKHFYGDLSFQQFYLDEELMELSKILFNMEY